MVDFGMGKIIHLNIIFYFIKIATEKQPGVLRTARKGKVNNYSESYLPCPACLVWIRESMFYKHKKLCPCRDSDYEISRKEAKYLLKVNGDIDPKEKSKY